MDLKRNFGRLCRLVLGVRQKSQGAAPIGLLTRRRQIIGLALASCLSAQPVFAQFTGAYSSFFRAIRFDDRTQVQALLSKGMDPNTPTEEGQPAISYAMFHKAHNSVRALLNHRDLNVNQPDFNGDTPLMVAAALNNASWIAALLSRGADLGKPGRWSALHYAATSGSVQAMGMLIGAGAEINAKSPNGTTALMMAARENKTEAVLFLLKNKADARAINQSGYTAAGYAHRANNARLAREIQRWASTQTDTASL